MYIQNRFQDFYTLKESSSKVGDTNGHVGVINYYAELLIIITNSGWEPEISNWGPFTGPCTML